MLFLCVCVLMLLEKPLKKHSGAFYFAAVIMALAGCLAQIKMQPGIVRTILTDYVSSGTLPAALFILVMSASSLPKDSRIFRCMMSLRGEMAILGSISSHPAHGAVLHGNRILLCKKLQKAA